MVNMKFSTKNLRISEKSSTFAAAFGKLVAMNDARVIGRQLPPLSPKIENFRGPQ